MRVECWACEGAGSDFVGGPVRGWDSARDNDEVVRFFVDKRLPSSSMGMVEKTFFLPMSRWQLRREAVTLAEPAAQRFRIDWTL